MNLLKTDTITSSENRQVVQEQSQTTTKTWLIIAGIIIAGIAAISVFAMTDHGSRLLFSDANAASDLLTKLPKPLPVNTIQISFESGATQTQSFTGTIRARQSSDLAFESPGTITKVLVREGEAVAKGQVWRFWTSEL